MGHKNSKAKGGDSAGSKSPTKVSTSAADGEFEKDHVAVVVKALEDIAAKDSKIKDVTLAPYKFDEKAKEENQFIFFLKPEVTNKAEAAKIGDIVKMALTKLEEAKVTIGACRVLSGDYLQETGIMQEHYGVINKLSREGEKAMTDAAKAKLEEKFGEDIKSGVKVYGAHELMKAYPDLTPLSLRVLSDNLGTERLAGGTYAKKYTIIGGSAICINPFHPFQLVPYTTPGNAIVVIEARSTTPWSELRSKICGATDPSKAEEGSIRADLMKNKDAYGLTYTPSSSANGCHMSAGPLEALVELKRFFAVPDKESCFGALLTDKGVKEDGVTKMLANSDLAFGDKTNNCFDATEELNAVEAADKLAAAK
eukprot:gb/GEZN01006152.1/.p1 GENE.gb/GEZN01006152.1/~~gb/GEZN01006152.1/.p1  ORF type:complete len:367 (+),score=83.28 gb/GEZN01006152.1/:50-1150(+)